MTWPLYAQGIDRRYPLGRRIRGPRRRSRHFGEGRNIAAVGNVTHSNHLSCSGNILYRVFQRIETQHFAGTMCLFVLYESENEISVGSVQSFHCQVLVMSKVPAFFEVGTEMLYDIIIKWTTVFIGLTFIFSAVPS